MISLPVRPVWDVVLGAGERVLLDGQVGYSRYYGLGGQAAYAPVSVRHYGDARPVTAWSIMRLRSAGNRGRAQAAAFNAATRWREQQQCRVVVTDRRVLCQVQAKGWISFDHAQAYRDPDRAATEQRRARVPRHAPLCLSGPIVTEIMVVVVWALYGAGRAAGAPGVDRDLAVAPVPASGCVRAVRVLRGAGAEPRISRPRRA